MTDQTTDNLAPEATTPPVETQPAQVDPAQELEALKAKYERAQADLTKFRTRADEVTAAQKEAEAKALAEADATKKAELLAAKVAELEKAAAEAAAKAVAAERRAALTGKVVDPTAALKLLDPEKHLDSDGNVNTEALVADYPFLKAGAVIAPATSGSGTNPKPPTPTAAVDALLKSGRQEDKARAAALLAQTMTTKG